MKHPDEEQQQQTLMVKQAARYSKIDEIIFLDGPRFMMNLGEKFRGGLFYFIF